MDLFVWLLYHNKEIAWLCLTLIIYKVLKEYLQEKKNAKL
jgi:hypothetical protein